MSRAYYNEIDPLAAAWLRELIARDLIAPGDVDERSIADVRPTDLVGYTQCHFFAGIGVWSHALRRAGWADDRPVWTGSCPCQPFSSAGARKGTSDERHLWPEFYRLIRESRPAIVFGEQVASPDGRAWLDAVCADLEASHYACGAADLCAAGIGAPHIRQRLYWVADTVDCGRSRVGDAGVIPSAEAGAGRSVRGFADGAQPSGAVRRLADADGGHASTEGLQRGGEHGQLTQDGGVGGLADANRERREGESVRLRQDAAGRHAPGVPETSRGGATRGADAPHVFGGAADWLLCTDGKWRPVEPGTFPLAHGAPARVGRLRGYGNAIHAEVAATFIQAYCEARALTDEREAAA